ncbi:MAG: glycerol kinase GlpK [Gammaproteobacteria bacterium]|nr:glycerol kinase GlpK [Gammaproteobacteria bacterium]MDH5302519.1 glycerol kinase GlpK [Gammaproteobacteria bacterium]MDH5322303.1 glycerol kinase GlpK [Gammaproteobacteria bacterium]
MTGRFLLAIDAGTSSTRAVIYNHDADVIAGAQQEFKQHYPQSGWVEHDAEEIWGAVQQVTAEAMRKAGARAPDITGIGITNQRETTVLWERTSGRCIYNAIVWQDRRTAGYCEAMKADGKEAKITARTGLRLDPYFSASKISWLLNNVAGARERADAGELAFGTIDTFILWRLCNGRVHATDASNASRTMLFNIHSQEWDDDLLALFDVPRSLLPEVHDCAYHYADADCAALGGSVPVLGIAGDQQAALIGQAGFLKGMTKSTYGTGCFVLANSAGEALRSHNRLLTTIASRLDGKVCYGLEGSVFVAGSALQWLRDELGLISSAAESEAIAHRTGVVNDVCVVPAFTGLGAPHWDPHARGAILGLSRGSSREQIVTATLQAVALQTADLISAMADDGFAPAVIRVDGGMVQNDWFLQFLADILKLPVERPVNVESTALGAAYLAGLCAGVFGSTEAIASMWKSGKMFAPAMGDEQRGSLLAAWNEAVSRVKSA